MNKSLKIINRGDLIGNNIIGDILQIIIGDLEHYYIKDIEDTLDNKSGADIKNSIFIQTLNEVIKFINKDRNDNNIIEDIIDRNDEYYKSNNIYSIKKMALKVCILTKQDILSYFREKYYNIFHTSFDKLNNKYHIDYDWSKIICLHLRLGDINYNNRFEYNGSYSSKFYLNKINDDVDYYIESEKIKFLEDNIPLEEKNMNPNIDLYDAQAPINPNILISIINKIKQEKPEHKLLIVASPYGVIPIQSDYVIRSRDENNDIYAMIQSDILICSKSYFSLTAAFLHKGSKIYLPMWGSFASLGFTSKYDKTSNIEYFY